MAAQSVRPAGVRIFGVCRRGASEFVAFKRGGQLGERAVLPRGSRDSRHLPKRDPWGILVQGNRRDESH